MASHEREIMTTPDKTFPENHGLNYSNREALRQLMVGVAREALRQYTKSVTTPNHQKAIDAAVGWQMSNFDDGGGRDLLPFIREYCAHMWVSTEAHVCADCGEIGSEL